MIYLNSKFKFNFCYIDFTKSSSHNITSYKWSHANGMFGWRILEGYY